MIEMEKVRLSWTRDGYLLETPDGEPVVMAAGGAGAAGRQMVGGSRLLTTEEQVAWIAWARANGIDIPALAKPRSR